MKFTSKLFLFLTITAAVYAKMSVRAVVTAPIIDLVGQRFSCNDVATCFSSLPLAPDKGSSACLRLHQLLFNQEVTIVRELFSGEVAVEVPGFFYLDGLHRKRHDFWMLKKDLIPISSLTKEARKAIPPLKNDNTVLILRAPWYHNKVTYSVGTRFVRSPEQDNESSYGILLLDPKTKRVCKAVVPSDKAVVSYHTSFIKKRRVFMSLLRNWAHLPQGFIPYVYGGCSFTRPVMTNTFSCVAGVQCGQKATYWQRKGYTSVPKSGFDCSNIILCAAQIAGLSYPYKNTLALVHNLRPLRQGESLEEGDLVWYSGHVMIVSDLKKNLLIEAIGYDSGYGEVHELPVIKVFGGIKNFEELKHVHFTKHLTYRLDSKGRPWRSVYRVKILKLATA